MGLNDFAMMREVVGRRYQRMLDDEQPLPDLVLIDGGKGQLSSAKQVLDELGLVDLPVIGLAKRLEEVFLPGAHEAQNIPKTSSALHLLQRIRDEAHRFAVSYQRKLRKKRTISSTLDNIKGIGSGKTAALLKHFGSIAALRKAGKDEIAVVPGIGPKHAAAIREYLQKSRTL